MKQIAIVLTFLILLPSALLAAREKVVAFEGGVSRPYESIGNLEVKAKAGGFLESFLYGDDSRGRGDRYRNALKKSLVRKAERQYGADAVIHVKYWPDPDGGKFPKGNVYARGEMIRYTAFPSTNS